LRERESRRRRRGWGPEGRDPLSGPHPGSLREPVPLPQAV